MPIQKLVIQSVNRSVDEVPPAFAFMLLFQPSPYEVRALEIPLTFSM
ncbi:hypothetical protein KP509_19G063600 [Ceratopteris richardii]|nr:hypothetical protein KP509_19G063600 [Ceratopteris richardii]